MSVLGAAALAVSLTLAACAVLARRRWILVTVDGTSMAPALEADRRVLVRRVRPGVVRVGQIVVVERPYQHGTWSWKPLVASLSAREWMIKRVVAVSGDPVPAEVLAAVGGERGDTVPAGSFVALGDNSGNSLDSRTFGYLPVDRLLGVVVRT